MSQLLKELIVRNQEEEKFIKILSAIKMGRALRILQCINAAYSGAASKLLIYAEEHTEDIPDAAKLFLRRNIVFERLRLLGRIFSKKRVEVLSRILENKENYE